MYKNLLNNPVVIRSSDSGVWLGELEEVAGDSVRILNARRAYYWTGAASCSGLATHGPSGGKIAAPVPIAVISGVCEVLGATPEAVERWGAVSPWIVT